MSEPVIDYNVQRHFHGQNFHVHAWADIPHDHLLRAVCNRPECEGTSTHNIHRGPK